MSENRKICCCHEMGNSTQDRKMEAAECTCECGAEALTFLDEPPKSELADYRLPELFSSGEETMRMVYTHQLTKEADAIWKLHKEVLDFTLESGWDNEIHPWSRSMQNFWKYPLAFSTYAIPSVAVIDPERYQEVCDYLRKSLLLYKDTPVWDGWKRQGYGDPITHANIMYKGHLNLIYGLYQLVSGSDEFEAEYKQLTKIIIDEYEVNLHSDPPYMGICCEPDQYFAPCNSVPLLSLRIYDILFGTDYDHQYGIKERDFLTEKLTDKETGLFFTKYHPSHDYAEAYVGGFANAWTLIMIHRLNKEHYQETYQKFITYFSKDVYKDQVYCVKETVGYDDISTAIEESMGTFYAPALAKEYKDPEAWEKFWRYFIDIYGMKIENGTMRCMKATPCDETFIQNYLFFGILHTDWDTVLDYDWKALQAGGEANDEDKL